MEADGLPGGDHSETVVRKPKQEISLEGQPRERGDVVSHQDQRVGKTVHLLEKTLFHRDILNKP